MDEEHVMDNETRQSLFNHILEYPGVSYVTLRKLFQFKDGTLRYHIQMLERGGKIITGGVKGKRSYYPVEGQKRIPKDRFVGLGPELSLTQERILNMIMKKPGINQKRLCKSCALNRFTLIYNTKKLMDSGYIRKYKRGKRVHYEYIEQEELKKKLLDRAIIDLLRGKINEETFLLIKDRIE